MDSLAEDDSQIRHYILSALEYIGDFQIIDQLEQYQAEAAPREANLIEEALDQLDQVFYPHLCY